jgi:hypothetical protein
LTIGRWIQDGEEPYVRKLIAALIVILIAVGAGWYASPIWTLSAMRDAAKAHDAERLSAHVDYPALRADLKQDIGAYVTAEAARGSPVEGGNLAAGIALAFIGPVIDAAVSPKGIEAMFVAEDRSASGARVNAVPVSTGDHPVIERGGFNSFRVHGQDASKGALVFRREGLSWKLVGVDLPAR